MSDKKDVIEVTAGMKLPIPGLNYGMIEAYVKITGECEPQHTKTYTMSKQAEANELLLHHIELAKEAGSKQVAPIKEAKKGLVDEKGNPAQVNVGKPGDHRTPKNTEQAPSFSKEGEKANSGQVEEIFKYIEGKGYDKKGSALYYQKHLYKPYNVTAVTSLTEDQAEEFLAKTRGE